MSSSSAAFILRMGLAGTPMTGQPAGTILPGGTSAPAPNLSALLHDGTVEDDGADADAHVVHDSAAWTTARWPIVTKSPTVHANSGVTCSTELSCTFELRPSVT